MSGLEILNCSSTEVKGCLSDHIGFEVFIRLEKDICMRDVLRNPFTWFLNGGVWGNHVESISKQG